LKSGIMRCQSRRRASASLTWALETVL